MIVHDVTQGTPEWLACRLGIPTASEFDKVITAEGKPSKQAEAYANRLIAEMMTGKPVNAFDGTAYTERGKELEPEAVRFYELQRDVDAVVVGFVTDDARTMGCSPDRLIGQDGLLEMKCPAAHTHVKYLLENRYLRTDYFVQVQGQMLVTGRDWADLVSYHPEMPPVIVRVERDPRFLAVMRDLLGSFAKDLAGKRQELVRLGYVEEA